jgi:para-nitrobenzyl esterase
VIDEVTLPFAPFTEDAVALSATVPLLIGWCDNELRLTKAGSEDISGMTGERAKNKLATLLRVSVGEVEHLFDVYKRSRPSDSAGDLYLQIAGDFRYRRNCILAAEKQIRHGGASVFTYALSWKSPVRNGILRTPHSLCVAFAFGNLDVAGEIAGVGPVQSTLQDQMSGAWVEFARSGTPRIDGVHCWPRYSMKRRETMVFDRHSDVASDPFSLERQALEPFPRYRPGPTEGEHFKF